MLRGSNLWSEGLRERVRWLIAERRRRLAVLHDRDYVRLVALLCHPAWGVRQAAAKRLAAALRETGAVALEPADERPLGTRAEGEELLARRNIGVDAAGAILMEMLGASPLGAYCAAVSALGVLGYRPAIPLLVGVLAHRPPELFVATVRALGRLGAREVAPLLADFAIEPPVGPTSALQYTLPIDIAMSLELMLDAYRWQAARLRQVADIPPLRSSDEWATQSVAATRRIALDDADLVAEALKRMGEGELLRTARGLSAGDAGSVRTTRDPRIFPALIVALPGRRTIRPIARRAWRPSPGWRHSAPPGASPCWRRARGAGRGAHTGPSFWRRGRRRRGCGSDWPRDGAR